MFILLCCATSVAALSTRQLLDSADYLKPKEPARALFLARQAYAIAAQSHDNKSEGDAAFIIGVTCYLTGSKDSALHWYLIAENKYDLLKETTGLVRVYTEMCVYYLNQKKMVQAMTIIDKAIVLAAVTGNAELLATTANNKGLVFQDIGKSDSAQLYFRRGYDYYARLSDKRGMAYSLNYLSAISAAKGQYDDALSYLKQSVALMAESSDLFGEAVGINNIGELLMQQHNESAALDWFLMANEKARKLDFKDLEDNTYVMMADCYERTGDYRKAYEAARRHMVLREQLAGAQLVKTIEELNTRYETGKKEQQNLLLAEENRLQQIRINQNLILLVAVVIIAGLIIGILLLLSNRRKLQARERLKDTLAIAEMQKVSAIMETEENERRRLAAELHDGIGQTLSAVRRSIASVTSKDDTLSRATSLLDDSINEVRQLSRSMMPPGVRNTSLCEAIAIVADSASHATGIAVTTSWVDVVTVTLSGIQELMIYRSVQEAINNVVRHAGATELHIEMVNHGSELTLLIYDNGRGFDTLAIRENSKGIGLGNIRARIAYAGGTVEIDSHPGSGTTISINIPLTKNNG